LDAVEISTTGGHYLALDMPQAPYPLGGEPRDVVEDVTRLGGFGVVAHPESPKPALRWRDWDVALDGLEWVNPDTSWRVRAQQQGWRSRWSIVQALAAYPFRPAETIARTVAGTALSADRWASLVRRRRLVVLSGTDAHANLGFSGDPGDAGWSLPFPGYEASFRTLSVHVQPEQELTGDAASDAAALMQGIRRGHVFTSIDGLAGPAVFSFTASDDRRVVGQGDELAGGGPVTLRIRSNAPPSFTTSIWADDRLLSAAASQPDHMVGVDAPGVYRVEIQAPSSEGLTPWIVSNPIYVDTPFPAPVPPAVRKVTETAALFGGEDTSGWRTESDRASLTALELVPGVGGTEVRLRYGLSGDPSSRPYVALAAGIPTGRKYDRVRFTVRSDRPLRVSVQLRAPGQAERRWTRTVYADPLDREHAVDFGDMIPVGEAPASPRLDEVRDVLFVIDTLHAKPGTSGRLWIKKADLERTE
jgi:hypothetical protein